MRQALLHIASTSLEAQTGNYSRFIPPQSYISLYDMQLQLGWIQNDKCIRSLDLYPTIVCPTGTYKMSAALVASSCQTANLTCPANYSCTCRPCVPVPTAATSVYLRLASSPSSAASSNKSACARVTVCLSPQQNQAVAVTIVDNLYNARASLGLAAVVNVGYRFRSSWGTGAAFTLLPASAATSGVWTLSVSTPTKGFFLLEVQVDGVSIDASPTIVDVVAVVCPATQQPDDLGVCGCATGYSRASDGTCKGLDLGGLIGGLIGGVVLLALLSTAAIMFGQHLRTERSWRIEYKHVRVRACVFRCFHFHVPPPFCSTYVW